MLVVVLVAAVEVAEPGTADEEVVAVNKVDENVGVAFPREDRRSVGAGSESRLQQLPPLLLPPPPPPKKDDRRRGRAASALTTAASAAASAAAAAAAAATDVVVLPP